MRKKNTLAFASMVLVVANLLGSYAHAGSSANGVTVVRIEANKGHGAGGLIFIKLSAAPTGKPACSNHYWDYTLALSTTFDESIYAALLAALASGRLVETTGMGSCGDSPSIESLRSVLVSDM